MIKAQSQKYSHLRDFGRSYASNMSDMFSDSDYSSSEWYKASKEKSRKHRKHDRCECRRDESCHECSFLSSVSEYSDSAVASTLPVKHQDKHVNRIRDVKHLVSSNDDRKGFINFMHKAQCRPGKCQEDCCLSWLSKISSSSSCSSSSSSCKPESSSSSSSSSSQWSEEEQLFKLFMEFLRRQSESSSSVVASAEVKEKVVEVYFAKDAQGQAVIKVTGRKDGKPVTKAKASLSFMVGDLVCFDIHQELGGKHKFCLTASPLGGPMSTPLAGSPLPMSSGKMVYQITKDTPKMFYYGASDVEGMGGKITVK